MITSKEALSILEKSIVDFGVETVRLEQSVNRIIKEDLVTDRPLPPYDRVSMDGIAIDYQAYLSGQRQFPIQGMAAAGMPKQTLQKPSDCLEVMTGAILPIGTDTVIPYEHLQIDNGAATIKEEVSPQQNVHVRGQDRASGETVVVENTRLSGAEINVAASVGKPELKVARLPKIIVISTGDELVAIEEKPLEHQIRRSNVFSLVTSLQAMGIEADHSHLLDDKASLMSSIGRYVEQYDILLLSGGVSKGKLDFIPEVLKELGVEEKFHRIKQKPGKPLWFGQKSDGTTVFGFPGNPISSFLCFHRYFLHWLHLSLTGSAPASRYAKLQKEVVFKKDLTYFQEIALVYQQDGTLGAIPFKGNGSGDLANLARTDAFIELPRGKDIFEVGEVYPVYFYRY
ncbi:MAG: molybdopterin molybdotransferase MoeA [Bacteroidota bacterium]